MIAGISRKSVSIFQENVYQEEVYQEKVYQRVRVRMKNIQSSFF